MEDQILRGLFKTLAQVEETRSLDMSTEKDDQEHISKRIS